MWLVYVTNLIYKVLRVEELGICVLIIASIYMFWFYIALFIHVNKVIKVLLLLYVYKVFSAIPAVKAHYHISSLIASFWLVRQQFISPHLCMDKTINLEIFGQKIPVI